MTAKINIETKIKICKILKTKTMKDREICNKFNISKGSLYRIKQKTNLILGKEIDVNESGCEKKN